MNIETNNKYAIYDSHNYFGDNVGLIVTTIQSGIHCYLMLKTQMKSY